MLVTFFTGSHNIAFYNGPKMGSVPLIYTLFTSSKVLILHILAIISGTIE